MLRARERWGSHELRAAWILRTRSGDRRYRPPGCRSLDIALHWPKFDMEASIKQNRDRLQLGKLLEERASLKVKMAEEKAR